MSKVFQQDLNTQEPQAGGALLINLLLRNQLNCRTRRGDGMFLKYISTFLCVACPFLAGCNVPVRHPIPR